MAKLTSSSSKFSSPVPRPADNNQGPSPALIASNLGQILGRAFYGEDIGAREKPQPKLRRRPDRRGQTLELVRIRGSVSAGELAAALGITGVHATVILYHMHEAGALERSGAKLAYRYSLPAENARG